MLAGWVVVLLKSQDIRGKARAALNSFVTSTEDVRCMLAAADHESKTGVLATNRYIADGSGMYSMEYVCLKSRSR